MNLERHPKNATGPFYVVNKVCLACLAPEHEAPGLMSHEDEPYYHCYFRRQPSTQEEVERAVMAVAVGCIQAVRYGGDDPAILQRLRELGASGACDHA